MNESRQIWPDVRVLQTQLQRAVIDCNERCLYHAAKWAAELNDSASQSIADNIDDVLLDQDDSLPDLDAGEARLQRAEYSKYLMAKSFFDCREYDRCAVTLMPSLLPIQPIGRKQATDTTPRKSPFANSKVKGKAAVPDGSGVFSDHRTTGLSQRSMFLALYAKYLAGEKRKEEDSEMILGPVDGPVTPNRDLSTVLGILERYFDGRGGLANTARSDGFLEYLYGVVLLKNKNDEYARKWLLKSVGLYQWNWSAWQELATCVESVHQLTQLATGLDGNIASALFQIYSSQELARPGEELLDTLDEVESIFPQSAFVQTQRALLLYHLKDFEEASRLFAGIMREHPYRLDSLDRYSDILFVDRKRPQLAHLASVASATDKFRPETCCIIGNYYSLIENHEEAVMYFRRALTLDRSYVSAWILMGHAYLELHGVRAAIESYRRALDANKNDYRAWNGLGSAYESLDMQSYALYYYQRAAALQPLEPKIWMAVGAAFKGCGKFQNAIRAYKRALGATSANPGRSDPARHLVARAPSGPPVTDPMAGARGGVYDDEILHTIAELYEEAGDTDEAAAYMELCLAQEEGPDEADIPLGTPASGVPSGIGVTRITKEARLWLARYCFSRRDWQRATELANELCQDGYEVEEAKALKRDVRSRIEAEEEELGRRAMM